MDGSFASFVFVAGILNFIKISWSSIYNGDTPNGICILWIWHSKLPYLLYPFIKVSDSGVNDSMGLALVIVFILGLLY